MRRVAEVVRARVAGERRAEPRRVRPDPSDVLQERAQRLVPGRVDARTGEILYANIVFGEGWIAAFTGSWDDESTLGVQARGAASGATLAAPALAMGLLSADLVLAASPARRAA